MSIIIPNEFKQKLGDKWNAIITQFVINVTDYISKSPYFFPEYTKHGAEHINQVLKLAVKLITVETLDKLNDNALGVLILSCIAHDLGMFLEKDGLKRLLEKPEENELAWKTLWKDYQWHLNQYSDADILHIFGIRNENSMKLPETFDDSMTDWQKKLCGEFLRRHHPRLAQEIVEEYFPGNINMDLYPSMDNDGDFRTLVALLARSHGMELNELDEMWKEFDEDAPEFPYGVPIYYLMAVLRLADYFDAGEDRAPHAFLAKQHIKSGISQEEFMWNQLVKVDDDWGDKKFERIFVRVKMSELNNKLFNKISNWLNSLQQELDICWRQLALSYRECYKLSVRRVDSNLMQKKAKNKLEKRLVLEEAQLQATPEILDLLVTPLYGNDYSYGVRELLQNAVDTCLEREKMNDRFDGQIRVEVNYEAIHPYFRIIDNGCGMTKDVILNHFLKAGSSYRNSNAWREKFEGKKVQRIGRFGVGVLAAFLLGDIIEVETKPFKEERSYSFSVQQNHELIEITRSENVKNIEIKNGGTCITIELSENQANEMKEEFYHMSSFRSWFHWYWLPTPTIIYCVNGVEYFNPYGSKSGRTPYSGLQTSGGWFRLDVHSRFDEVWWRPESHHIGKIFCNGIWIEHSGFSFSLPPKELSVMQPSLSLMDSQDYADINLTRTWIRSLTSEILEELYQKTYKALLARLMLRDNFKSDKILYHTQGYMMSNERLLHSIQRQQVWCVKSKEWRNLPQLARKQKLILTNNHHFVKQIGYEEKNLDENDTWKKIANQLNEETGSKISCYTILKQPKVESRFSQIWDTYFGDELWIPYDLAERKKKFPKFFDFNDEMYQYMLFWNQYDGAGLYTEEEWKSV